MATLLVVSASPAMAQTFFVDRGDFDRFGNVGPASQEFSIRRITSGAASPVTRISNTGSNVNLCPTTQQVVNTGNVVNEQGVVQDSSGFTPVNDNGFVFIPDNRFGFFPVVDNFGFGGDIDITGSEINIAPTVSGSCTQTIGQAAAA